MRSEAAQVVAAGGLEPILVIPADDDWTCDWCCGPIGLDGPIVLAESDALCHRCAYDVVRGLPNARVGNNVFLPVCPCPACTQLSSRRTIREGQPQ